MIDTDFVGRRDQLQRILEAGDPDGSGAFFDVEGIPGIGKTSLLGKLAKVAREKHGPDGIGEIIPVPIDCEGVAFMAPRPPGSAPTDEDVLASEGAEYREFHRMLLSALDNLPDNDAKSTIRQALDQYQLEQYQSGASGVNFLSNNPVWEPRDLADLRRAEAETLAAVTEATEAAARNLAAQSRRLLILVDQFHLLEGRPLGRWLTALLAGVTSATVVVMHQRFRDPGGAGLPDRAIALPLRNLSREDVETYLNIRTDLGPKKAEVYRQVWQFTDGHPGALALAADFVRESKSAEESARHIRQIGALQGGREDQLRDLVTRILRAINDDDLRNAMACACVTRHFDEPLLARLLDDPDPGHVQRLIDQLTDYSFVYRVAANDESAGPRFLAVSDFVRSVGAERLGTRQSEIHRRAAEYYRQGIVDKWAEDDTSYASWLRYEDPEFQVMVSDWLYHLSNLTLKFRSFEVGGTQGSSDRR